MKKHVKRFMASFLVVIMLCSTIQIPAVKAEGADAGKKWITIQNGPSSGGGHTYGQATGPSFLYDSSKTMPKDGEMSLLFTPLSETLNFGLFYVYQDDNTWLYIGNDSSSGWYYQFRYNGKESYPQLSGLPAPIPGEPMAISVSLSRETLQVTVNGVTASAPNQNLFELTEALNGTGKFGIMAKGSASKTEFADFSLNQEDCMEDSWEFLVTRAGQTANERYARVSKVEGTVVDVDGNPFAGATVRVGLNKTTTDVDGRFSFSEVQDGDYTVSVSAPGHRPATQGITIFGEDITDIEFTLLSKGSIEKDNYDYISSASMKAYIGKDFPVVVHYELGEDTFYGQEEEIGEVKINGISIVPEVTSQSGFTSGAASKTYGLILRDETSQIDLEMDVTISVEGNNLTWEVTRIEKKDGCPEIATIEVPNLNLITIDQAQTGAGFAGAKASTTTTVTGDVFKTFEDGFMAGQSDSFLYGIITSDKLSAALWSNSEAEGDKRVALNCGADTMSLTSAPWYYERGDKNAQKTTHTFPVKSDLPCAKVSIVGDLNGDDQIDWNDGALGFRAIMNYPQSSEVIKEMANYRIIMNFASMAPNPFQETADNVKKVYLATDGLKQALLLKGYGNEGHDSANSEYADIGERLGGVDEFGKLIEISHDYNTEVGIHVNAQEAYPEAASFSENMIKAESGALNGYGWGWLDQSFVINKLWDLSTQARWKRFVQLYDRINGTSFFSKAWPEVVGESTGTVATLAKLKADAKNRPHNMDFVYLDVWYQDAWETRRIAEEINSLGWRFTTEFSSQGEYDSTWQHWSTDAVYGGATSKGFNSDIIRFIRNDHRDSQVLNYPSFGGTADNPLLGGYRLYGFEGWGGDQDFNAYITGTFNENIPTKFLQHYYVTKWENYEKDESPTGNHEKEITLRNDAGDQVVVTRKEQQRRDSNIERIVTLNGKKVLEDVTYLLPWTDEENGEEKLYHWNLDGGTTTWELQDEWNNLSTVIMYELTDQGRVNEQTIDVVDGTVTLTAPAAKPYLLVKGAKRKTLKEDFGEANYVVDPGFNGYAGQGEKLTAVNWTGDINDASITVEKAATGDQRLVMDSPKTQVGVSTTIKGLTPGKHYVAEIYIDNRSDKRASIEVVSGIKTVSNYTLRSIAQNYIKCDEEHRTTQVPSYMQIMQVSFVANARKATLTLKREAGAGATYWDDIRIVEKELNNYKEDGSFEQDFETVVQGLYPFVLGSAQGVNDPCTHLSQLHDPFTQSGWNGKVLDDVIDGNWSLKHHDKNTGIIYQTIPQNFRFEPGKVYKVSFDYQSGPGAAYAFVIGNGGSYTTASADDYFASTIASPVGSKSTTKRHEMQVIGALNGQTWIGLYCNSSKIASNSSALGGFDFILDNLKIEEDPDAFEIEISKRELYKGEKAELLVSAPASVNLIWEFSEDGVVELDADKKNVLAIGAGEVTITATIPANGEQVEKSRSITVTVKDKASTDITMGAGVTAYANNFQPLSGSEGPPSLAIDKKPDTFWHTAWSGFTVSESNPAILTIDLGEKMSIGGFKFQQRPSANNGLIQKFKYAIGTQFTSEAHKIEDVELSEVITTSAGGGGWTSIELEESIEAQFIQIQVVAGQGNYAAIAEVVPTSAKRIAESATLADQVMEDQRTLVIEPEYAPNTILKGIEWKSSDDKVVKVESMDNDGSKARLTAKGAGTATITITNAAGISATATVTVIPNKTALSELITEAESLDLTFYYQDNNKTAFVQALQTAKEIEEKARPTQTEVDNALANLNGAKSRLKDKSALQEYIAEIKELDLSRYMDTDAANDFKEALQELENIFSKANATEAEVLQAIKDLETTQGKLVLIANAGKEILTKAKAVDLSKYVDDEKAQAFKGALAALNELVDNADATDAELLQALTDLDAAQGELTLIADVGREAYAAAEALDFTKYMNDVNAGTFKNALVALRTLLISANAAGPDLLQAISDLEAAWDNLVLISTVGNEMITEAEAVDLAKYLDDANAQTFEDALETLKELVEKADVAGADLLQAINDLEVAQGKLVLIADAGSEILSKAEALDLTNYLDDANLKTFKDALEMLKELVEKVDVTDADLLQAINNLEAAQSKLTLIVDFEKTVIENIASQVYTGHSLNPAVTVTYEGKTLVKDKDYKVSYSNNKNIGTAKVTITGLGAYKGSKITSFNITVIKNKVYTIGNYKYKITNADTSGKGTVTVTGVTKKSLNKIKVKATVSIGGKKFKVTRIGAAAFKNCKKATKATIGKNVIRMDANAFRGCRKLKKIIIKGTGLKHVKQNALKGISKSAKIKVPASKLGGYRKWLKNKGQSKTVKIVK